jgi:hypothetical protein
MRNYDRTEWTYLTIMAATIIAAPFLPNSPVTNGMIFGLFVVCAVCLVRHMFTRPS